jgi:hypothetical protein
VHASSKSIINEQQKQKTLFLNNAMLQTVQPPLFKLFLWSIDGDADWLSQAVFNDEKITA